MSTILQSAAGVNKQPQAQPSPPCKTPRNHVELGVIQSIIGPSRVAAALAECGTVTQRERKLTLPLIVWLMIAASLWRELALCEVFDLMTASLLRDEAAKACQLRPGSGALSHRRHQLGARPVVRLFHQVCQPLATDATRSPGSFLFGLRLMAIDGQTLNLPDTPENDKYFGRHGTNRGAAAFPQAQAVYLCECGTHAIVDAGIWPCHTTERIGCDRFLRSVGPGMLLMWDRGFSGMALLLAASERKTELLVRLPDNIKPIPVKSLPDGTHLVRMETEGKPGSIILRLISYKIDALENSAVLPPQAGETGKAQRKKKTVTRLLTSLLDPEAYPALLLAQTYHERWEIELVADEIETHQMGKTSTMATSLRSKKPVLVIQEFFAMLLAHYCVRVIMQEAADKVGVEPDRISFVHTLRLIEHTLPYFHFVAQPEWPRLYARMLDEIARYVLPPRAARNNKRGVKKKMSTFPMKRKADRKPPKPTKPYKEATILCPNLI